MVKIGDKVRFLNDVGGGIVCGFQGKNIVLVEDENGFDIPTLINEVVVIEEQKTKPSPHVPASKEEEVGQRNEVKENTPLSAVRLSPRPSEQSRNRSDWGTKRRCLGFGGEAVPLERPNADRLTVLLSFVPVNIKELSKTTFEAYLINDCNYFISFALCTVENASWTLRSQGIGEPNTKLFLEEITYADLNAIQRIGVQLIAWKQDRPFAAKQPVSINLRIDTTKFYKLHTFRESLFFNEPTLEYDIVRDDQPNSRHTQPLPVKEGNGRLDLSPKYDKNTYYVNGEKRVTAPFPHREGHGGGSVIEVDLHAHELLETTAGMSAGDIKEHQLTVFRETMNAHLKEKGRRIVFIHGKGEGVLRQAIVSELKHSYKSCTWQDASFQQYGFGATMVVIH